MMPMLRAHSAAGRWAAVSLRVLGMVMAGVLLHALSGWLLQGQGAAAEGVRGALDCLFKAWTGIECPLCGGTHAVFHLLRGEPGQALEHNAAVTVLVVVALLRLAWWALQPGWGRAAAPGTAQSRPV